MKKYRYSDLSNKAKKVAAQDYIDGWLEGREDKEDTLTLHEAHSLCEDTEDEILYDRNGNIIEEEE